MDNSVPMKSQHKRKQLANLDAISLAQALRDFETANARVLDLTQRLVESERRRADLSNELEHMRLRVASAEAEMASQSLGDALKLSRRVLRKIVQKAYFRLKNT